MESYSFFLKNLTSDVLKKIIRTYMSHVKIIVSKKTKNELIDHILEHTILEGDKIITKKSTFNVPEIKKKVSKKVESKKIDKKELQKEQNESSIKEKNTTQKIEDIKKEMDKYSTDFLLEGPKHIDEIRNLFRIITNPDNKEYILKIIDDMKYYNKYFSMKSWFFNVKTLYLEKTSINKTNPFTVKEFNKHWTYYDKLSDEVRKHQNYNQSLRRQEIMAMDRHLGGFATGHGMPNIKTKIYGPI
jgi:hypothetical protein